MADFTAKFELIDEMSSKLSGIADSGQEMAGTFDTMGDKANDALNGMSGTAENTASAVDGVAHAVDSAADSTDYWTDKVGNYDKEALEMIYTTEELVEMGYKTEDALIAEAEAADELTEEVEKTEEAIKDLTDSEEEHEEEGKKSFKEVLESFSELDKIVEASMISSKVDQMTQSAMNLAKQFSEAESTIIKATGASGSALDDLDNSMMEVYANTNESIGSVASAVGEINTRLGLTGDELTETTNMFVEFARVTGTDVTASVQNASKIMNKYGLEADELSGVLDQLAYAGQISGISVSSLESTLISGAATFQSAGLTVENAIALLSDFELAGISSQRAVTGLRTAVNNFTSEGLDANEALIEVVAEIAAMEDQAEATTLATETFGSMAGQEMVNAIRTGALSVDSFTGSLEDASGTVAETADASLTLSEQWDQVTNKMNATITSILEPALSNLMTWVSNILDKVMDFVNEHPKVQAALKVVVAAVAAFAVGLAAVTVALTAATVAVKLFGEACQTVFAVLGIITAAIAAVVAIVTVFKNVLNETDEATVGMTASTREQYYALQDLNEEYEQVVAESGDMDTEALRLKNEIDDLTAAFEGNYQTVEEFTAEVDDLVSSVDSITSSYQDAIAEQHENEVSTMALIQRYEDLASKTELAEGEETQLDAVTKSLTDKYPDLIEELDGAEMSVEEYTAALRDAVEAETEEQRKSQQYDTWIEALGKQTALAEEIEKASENLSMQEDLTENWGWAKRRSNKDAIEDLEAYQTALEELEAAQAENDALIASIEQEWADIAEAEAEAATGATSMEDAMTEAYELIYDEVAELCEAYTEAYDAALESFQGQFGLFDEAEANMEASVEAAQAALDSQLAYWDQYYENIEVLSNLTAEQLGITQESYDNLMANVQGGSETAAGLAASMVEAVNAGNTQAITDLATTMDEIAARQEETADLTAEWQTGFTEQMQEYADEMADIIVNDLDLSDEAAESATETIEEYANAILAGIPKAEQAAKQVANAVSAQLTYSTSFEAAAPTQYSTATSNKVTGVGTNASGTMSSTDTFIAGEEGHELIITPAHATGTTSGENFYLAGENGPELIVGQPGSEVFPTSETDRLINALSGARLGSGSTGTEKKITIDITGGGSINVTGGRVDQEQLVSFLYQYLKPVLMEILQQEIYEEGDYSYEY